MAVLQSLQHSYSCGAPGTSIDFTEEFRQTARTLTCLPQVCGLFQHNCGDPDLFTNQQRSCQLGIKRVCGGQAPNIRNKTKSTVEPEKLAHPLQPQSSSQAAYAATDDNHRILEFCERTSDLSEQHIDLQHVSSPRKTMSHACTHACSFWHAYCRNFTFIKSTCACMHLAKAQQHRRVERLAFAAGERHSCVA